MAEQAVSGRTLAQQVADVSTLDGEFVLRSGQVAHRYFDKYQFEARPEVLRPLAERMLALLPADTEILAGLELGGVPLATAMSLASGLPAAFVRKERKAYGTCRIVEGPDVAGRRVTIIEDVVTTGGQIVESVGVLRDEGARIDHVVCALWRGTDLGPLTNAGLELRWVLTPADFD